MLDLAAMFGYGWVFTTSTHTYLVMLANRLQDMVLSNKWEICPAEVDTFARSPWRLSTKPK